MKSKTKKQREAIGYVGMTGPRTAKRGAAAANPRGRIRTYVQHQGWSLLNVFSQVSSARDLAAERSALLEAVEEACQRRAVLVVRCLSELAGSVAGVVQICGQLHKAGADLAAIQERIDTTQDDGFFFGLMKSLGQLAGQRRVAPPPFGFSLAEDGEHVVVNPRQQEVIRQMVAWRAKGSSPRTIAAQLKSRKIAGPAGKAWNPASVRTVLAQAPTARWDGLADAQEPVF